VRVVIALVTLGVFVYGIYCLVAGRLVSEGMVLEGIPARLLGATIAVLAVITMARTIYLQGGKR
jgi:hypothetical protein